VSDDVELPVLGNQAVADEATASLETQPRPVITPSAWPAAGNPDNPGHSGSASVSAETGIASLVIAQQPLDQAALRHSFAAFPTGVTLVAAQVAGQPAGMLANSFTSVSLDPPLVSLSIGRHSPTLARLRRAPSWGISVLGAQQQAAFRRLVRHAGVRFDGVDTIGAEDGSLRLPGAAAHFRVSPQAELEAGDHVIIVLRVLAHERDAGRAPLVFHGSGLQRLQR